MYACTVERGARKSKDKNVKRVGVRSKEWYRKRRGRSGKSDEERRWKRRKEGSRKEKGWRKKMKEEKGREQEGEGMKDEESSACAKWEWKRRRLDDAWTTGKVEQEGRGRRRMENGGGGRRNNAPWFDSESSELLQSLDKQGLKPPKECGEALAKALRQRKWRSKLLCRAGV